MAQCSMCGRQMAGFSFGKRICRWCVEHEAAQRGEESEVQRVETPPWLRDHSSSMLVTQAIFGINVAVFVGMVMAGVSLTDPTAGELWHWGANFGPMTMTGQWWRLLTCVFVHIGIIHIALNMWCLWGLGRLAESVYDHWTFAAVYLITGVGASVASLAWNPFGTSAGASGAIFGIAGALIASFYLGEFSLPRSAVSGLLRSVVTFAGYNLVFGAMSGHTDNAAHVGGLVTGLVLGALIARFAPARDEPFRRIAVLFCGVMMVAGGVGWLQHSRGAVVTVEQAQRAFGEGRTAEAIAQLKAAVRRRPDYWQAHVQLARGYTLERDYAKAAAELERVIQINPGYLDGYYYLGYTQLELQQPQQARASFTRLLKLDPKSADAHAGLAAVSSFENKYADALAEYERTAQLDPTYQSLSYDMGLMQSKLGRWDDAIQSFLKQRDSGDDADNENALAAAYEQKGMTKDAAAARERARGFQTGK